MTVIDLQGLAYQAPTCTRSNLLAIACTGRRIRFEIVDSTGRHPGAAEIGIRAAP